MSQKVFDCPKLTCSKQPQKVHLLLSNLAVSIFWVLAVSEASLAQVNQVQPETNDLHLGNTNLLPVPSSSVPVGKAVLGLQTVPPPPTTDRVDGIAMPATGFAYAPIGNPLPVVPSQPVINLQQQERGFIQQQVRGRSNSAKPQVQKPKTVLQTAVGGDNSDFGLGLVKQGENLQPQLPPLPGQVVAQEFTAPTTPTFNQVLNSQVAPLPPLPGTTSSIQSNVSTPTPTFNQLLTTPTPATPTQPKTIVSQQRPQFTSSALKEPYLQFQGVYVTQGGDTSARARVTGVYPISPQALFGATIDLTSEGSSFDDSRREGLNINELYLATSIAGIPNLRFVVGQMDLTSYFDRNSFAKDGASQFFNPVFQTNPALAATGIASRPGLLVNWSVTDNIEAKAAVFSSSDKISDFSLDGFAGEVGIRYGNAIIRGTYASNRDGGVRDSFAESYSIARGNNQFGPIESDREEAYGLNAEVFIPNLKLGLFGRYGRYENRDLGQGADTYVLGATLLDLFTRDDRLGLAYGRGLSNESLRRSDQSRPDVVELYYDFQLIPNLRLGFTVQGRDNFSETVVGVRVKSEFDVTPRGRNAR
ncbi:carbohydrate porin [Tolypothrix sp. FACHB-123]|uniref:carbohydrate porin n=1 Tax=Tolypothrix sp. FACHB-123 TaxID=2692868 RepID=UPI001689E9F4|nr:carbohydrate porin [Tolypothrix sp. FACHB-123]MBD2354581.1 carbohydrate porin [Tolypothrix sp. FACHB-123]